MAAKSTNVAPVFSKYKKPSSFGSPALTKAPGIPKPIAGLAAFAAPSRPTSAPAGAAGAGAPAGGPPPASSSLPVDPLYDQTIAGLDRTKGDTLADITRQRGAGLLGYGYTATYGQDGLVQGLAYDPNNPYSQAAMARTVYQQSKAGTTNSMAARGQLNSGAQINAQNQNDTGFNVGENSRQTSLINFLNGLTGQEKLARDNYDTGKLSADGDRLGRAPTNPNYSANTPAAAAPAPAAATATQAALQQFAAQQYTVQPGKNSKGQSGVWHTYSDGRPRVFIVGAVR